MTRTRKNPSIYSRFVNGAASRIVADLPPEDRARLQPIVAQHLRTELRGTFGTGRVELYVPLADTDERQARRETMSRALEAGQPAAIVARNHGQHFTTVYGLARRLRSKNAVD